MSPEEWLASKTQQPSPITSPLLGNEEESLSPEQWLARQSQQIVQQGMPKEGTLAGAKQAVDVGRDTEYQFDPRVPQASTVIGAVIGMTPFGRAAKSTSALAGALKGGLEGGVAGLAGETIRTASGNSNYGQAAALGAEFATGAARNVIEDVIQRAPSYALGATQGYQLGKTIQTVLGGEPGSEIMAKEKIFGTKNLMEGAKRSVATARTQQELGQELANYGVVLPQGKKASDAVRDTLYTKLNTELANGNPLLVTKRVSVKDPVTGKTKSAVQVVSGEPEFVDLLANLKQLSLKDEGVTEGQINKVRALFNRQVSTDPNFANNFNEELINTLQKADPKFEHPDFGKLTPLVRDAFDAYSQRVNNGLGFNALKSTEQREFAADAIDSIPVILEKKFNLSDKDVVRAFGNIKKSPEGQKGFQVALGTYFKNLPSSEVLTNWNRLDKFLDRNKLLPAEEIFRLRRQIDAFHKRGLSGQAKDVALYAIKNSIARSVIPAELSSLVFDNEQPKEETQYTL